MKHFLAAISAIVIIFCLTACQKTSTAPGTLYIKPAELNYQEKKIAQLLGADTSSPIFDFSLDASVKSVQINTYELVDSKWKLISGGGGRQLSQAMGRIALEFEKIPEGLRTAIQCGNDFSSSSYKSDNKLDTTGMGYGTSILSNFTELEYDKEIGLAVQMFNDAQQGIRMYGTEYFNSPEEYEKLGYDHVYAISIMFSQKSVGELTL